MAITITRVSSGRYLLEKQRALKAYKLVKASDSNIVELMKNREEIAIELFLDDSTIRTHKEIASDLDCTVTKVKMMRHQLKNGVQPMQGRINLLTNFYLK